MEFWHGFITLTVIHWLLHLLAPDFALVHAKLYYKGVEQVYG